MTGIMRMEKLLMYRLSTVAHVLRDLCQSPDISADPSRRLDSIPRLDSIILVQAVAEFEQRFGVEVDFERMENVQTLGDLEACFPPS